MIFITILDAVDKASPVLSGRLPYDHKPVDNFQDRIIENLNNSGNGYIWYKEIKVSGRKNNDRIDIIGTKNGANGNRTVVSDNDWIIELDATRSDQFAKKFLSRVATCGLSREAINYVAVLYPRKNDGTAECIKYARYANNILQKINKRSKFYLIIVNPENTNGEKIRFIDGSKTSTFEVKKKKGIPCFVKGMGEAAKTAISMYCGITNSNVQTSTIHFSEIKSAFGNYVSDKIGKDRKKECGFTSSDGIPVYSYTQWRNNLGPQSNWDDFVLLCCQLGITITEIPVSYA